MVVSKEALEALLGAAVALVALIQKIVDLIHVLAQMPA